MSLKTIRCEPSLAAMPEMPGDVRIESPVLYETAPRAWRRDVVDEVDAVAVASPC